MKEKFKKTINKVIIFIIILCISKLNTVEATQVGISEELGSEIRSLQQLLIPIREINQRIEMAARTAPTHGTSVLLGVTGSGKTTLFNLLLGIPLCAKKGMSIGNPVIIDLMDSERYPRYEIEEGPVARTRLPNFDQGYCDLPGFNDIRTINSNPQDSATISIQEIINAYTINKVLRQINPIKIVAVTNYVHLAGRMAEFSSFLQHIGTIFQNNSVELTESLSLIITRFPQHFRSAEDSAKDLLRETFKSYHSPQNIRHFNAVQRFALEKLLELNNAHISFLYEPSHLLDQIGSDIDDMTDIRIPLDHTIEKSLIEEAIQNVTALHQIQPYISLSDNATSRINRACNVFNELISQTVDSVYTRMPLYINSLVLNAPNISGLRETFREVIGLLENLSLTRERYSLNFDNIVHILRIINENAGAISTLENVRPFLDFFELTHLPDTIDPAVWQKFSNRFVSLLRLFETPPHIERRNDVLFMKGLLVSTSDILPELEQHPYTKINIYALHSLFLDQHIERPELNVGFWAPYWITRTQESMRIDVSGSNGTNYEAQAENEHDGLLGILGSNGGKFYGELKHFYGPMRLIINASGGNGGNGQDGGNGKPGAKIDAKSREFYTLNKRLETERNFFVPTNVRFRETYISGKEGRPGGNGGNAGNRGFIQINNGRHYGYIDEINNDGRSGEGGKGGRHGGDEGNVYKGVYIAEHILPWLTGIKEKLGEDDEVITTTSQTSFSFNHALQNACWALKKLPLIGATGTIAYMLARTDMKLLLGTYGVIMLLYPYNYSHWEKEVEDLYVNKSRNAIDGVMGLIPVSMNEDILEQERINYYQDTQYYENYYAEQRNRDSLLPLFVSHT